MTVIIYIIISSLPTVEIVQLNQALALLPARMLVLPNLCIIMTFAHLLCNLLCVTIY